MITYVRALFLLSVVNLLLFSSSLALAQKSKMIYFPEIPKGFNTAVNQLPPGFAPAMNSSGKLELLFSPGMFNPKVKDFFSYVFVWALDRDSHLSLSEMTSELKIYYQGLQESVSKKQIINKGNVDLKSLSSDNKSSDIKEYEGHIRCIEPFQSKKAQTLKLKIVSRQCPKQKRLVAKFMVAPASKASASWPMLKGIKWKPCP